MDEDRPRRGEPHPARHEQLHELHVGIADEDSYLRRAYYPTGVARGWRRTGCIAAIAVVLAVFVLALVVAALSGGG
ncbi:hypothetical protein PO878_13110 [Iamia majanohamensis]|uniref:Uncharacterized protein n=1 Tax=Iamia majanohamensis TaxID=467976 RepID=A0AAE9Y340_9ACTN|nr:hypothetical protein [Iamia majanohamensis]WCO65435.1 hypothetical protein PO878_13110 [Iamia majanohamensis]